MADHDLLSGLVIETADPPGMREGAAVFARAMGRGEAHVEEWLFEFSKRLTEAGIGRFLTARLEDNTVGYGSLVVYERIGWIGFMGTEPDLQGKGIGAAVMESLLSLAWEAGLKTVRLDATDIGKGLYAKFGFKEEYPARRYEIPGQCTRGKRRRGPEKAVRIADRLPDWCRALDLRAFGDDRSALLEVALRHGGKVLLVKHRGFGILDGRKLGPVVAEDVDAAVDIVRYGAGLGANVIYVPHHKELPRRFLTSLSLPFDRGPVGCCTRMILGETVEQGLALAYADYSAATG
jgi:GNAT superfamily N-acetyltransferase